MFKIGDKVILNLETKHGYLGCDENDHNRVFIITNIYSDTNAIIEPLGGGVSFTYGVETEMLTPIIKIGEQLVFDWFKEKSHG